MKTISGIALISIALLLVCTDVLAVDLIKAGPYGKPIVIMDEAGNYSIPIKVYSDSEREIYIPNLTDRGWILWHKDEFNQNGTYRTVIYNHFKKDSYCRRELLDDKNKNTPAGLKACSELRYRRNTILVDTRNKNVTFLEVIYIKNDARWYPESVEKMNLTIPLSGDKRLSKVMQSSISKITAIIRNEIKNSGNSPSAQETLRHNKEMTSRMAEAGRASNGKSIEDVHCERDCYPGSEFYDGLHLYDEEKCQKYCTSENNKSREEAAQEIRDCNEVIKLDPNNADTYFKRGKAYTKLGFSKGFSDIEKAARLGSEEARKHLMKKYGIMVR